MPLPQLSGTLGKKRAAHLLRRATFGPTKTDIDTFSNYTVSQALNVLFQPVSEPAPPVNPATGTTWIGTAPSDQEKDSDQIAYFRGWWIGQMAAAGIAENKRLAHMTRERIVFFLHTHFTMRMEAVESSRALYYYNALLRKYAFDAALPAKINIKELTKKISIDNAMIMLLDGRLNVKGSPNENYARELLELYTVGRGLPTNPPPKTKYFDPVTQLYYNDYGTFTELDVKQAAKVLSGWDFDNTFSVTDTETGLPIGKVKGTPYPNQHDTSTKTFSNRFKNKTISSVPVVITNQDGTTSTVNTQQSLIDEISALVEMIYTDSDPADEAARNICRRLYRFYIYHEIDADIDRDVIEPLVTTFKANNYKIEPVIKDILGSQLFYDGNAGVTDDTFGGLIKSPLEVALGTLNFFEYKLPDPYTESQNFYEKTSFLLGSLKVMGLDFLNPIDVAGYEAYHQFPLWNRSWIATNALVNRYKFVYDVIKPAPGPNDPVQIDLLSFFRDKFSSTASDPDALIADFISYMLPMYSKDTEITDKRINYFKSQFLAPLQVNANPVGYWQESWGLYTDPVRATDLNSWLSILVNSILQTPEYQLF